MKFAVLLSLFNEQDIIEEMIARFDGVSEALIQTGISSVEICIVDDASTDNSWNVLCAAQTKFANLRCIKTASNVGVTDCFFLALSETEADIYVYMDSDLQDPPELLPEMLRRMIERSCEVLHTRRLKREGENYFKLAITDFGYKFINHASGSKIPKNCGDFKMFTAKVRKKILSFPERVVYLRHIFSIIGGTQDFFDYVRKSRIDGSANSKMKIFSNKVLDYWFYRAFGSAGVNSLKMTLFLALVLGALSIIAVLIVVTMKLQGALVPGSAGPMLAVFVMGSMNLMFTGLIAIFVSVITQEIKHRPRYFIDEEVKIQPKDIK